VILKRGEQKTTELTLEPVDMGKGAVLQQVEEKTLGEVLGVFGRISTTSGKDVERIPIESAQFGQSRLPPFRLAFRRPHDDRPARSMKARRTLRWRTMVAFHDEVEFHQK
jgi:hypothetical protein